MELFLNYVFRYATLFEQLKKNFMNIFTLSNDAKNVHQYEIDAHIF